MSHEVPVQPAATVMLVRDGEPGLEVFMLRRTTQAVFASGMYVFPGGRVDPADGEGDDAFLVAAIRECFEEAGVLLATGADDAVLPADHPVLDARRTVHAGDVDLRQLVDTHGLRLRTDALTWVSHWVTPRGERARRFDTRFYLAVMPEGQHSVHDDTETVASLWIRPDDALARGERGELQLMPPTIANLHFLADHGTVTAALEAAHRIGTPPRIEPRFRVDASGGLVGIALPGDVDYDALG
ncbi:MAG: NUDIX hydrolase [Ilumatobacteraceae bacterium]